jgi:hypothetical protein
MEVLVNVFFREVWEALELDPGGLEGVLDCGFKNQLTAHLPRFLTEPVDLGDADLPPGRWHRDCYALRNEVVHKGYRPSSAQAMDAKVATRAFVVWIGSNLTDDQRTAQIKAVLQGSEGEQQR